MPNFLVEFTYLHYSLIMPIQNGLPEQLVISVPLLEVVHLQRQNLSITLKPV